MVLCILGLAAASPPAEAQPWLEYAPELESDLPLSSPLYGLSDYIELPQLLADESVPLSHAALQAQLRRIWLDSERDLARAVFEDRLPASQLRVELADSLGIAPLLAGLQQRPLRFAILDEHYGSAHSERLLVFEDPLVGRFAARVLEPERAGPLPTLLALPGHDRDVYEFCVEFSCQDYVDAGYIVAVLQLRADESGALEHAMAAYLLSEGFNLAGLHVYEALLLARYLRSQPQVDGRRLSLLGHSGGAVLAGMLASLEPGFSALVSDTTAVFSEDMDGGLLCSTSHLLYPYHPQLADFESLPAARLFEYGYPSGSAAVLQFLEKAGAAAKVADEPVP
jgi:hypothetical protein